MKLNLGCGQDLRTSGYLNIDKYPSTNLPREVYQQGDIQSLDWIVEDNTVEEIIALDCIEYLPINVIKLALLNWAAKLCQNGILKILMPDCFAVAKAFAQGQFNLDEYLQITFGKQENDDNRLSAMDMITLCNILNEAGLTITLKRYEGVAIYIEATKL